MPAPQRIVELFEKNKKAYLSSSYNETQIRRAFIDPMFEELGWDVDNSLGKAEEFKEICEKVLVVENNKEYKI